MMDITVFEELKKVKSPNFIATLMMVWQAVKSVVLDKKTYANLLGLSVSSVDKQISMGRDVAPYKKLGQSKNSKVIFNIVDVVEYLMDTKKVFNGIKK